MGWERKEMNEQEFIEERTNDINTIAITDSIDQQYLREICQKYCEKYGPESGQLNTNVSCEMCATPMNKRVNLDAWQCPNCGHIK
ncbi:MAG: hypothetical protein GY820_38530 [Gammaproteobacteria bacterium]|nr:hypothetical protein [Gammaproteobacteria bacterium]